MRLSKLFIDTRWPAMLALAWILLPSFSLPALAQDRAFQLPPYSDDAVRALAESEFKGNLLRSEVMSGEPISHSPFDSSGSPSYMAWEVRQGKKGRLMHAAFLVPESELKKEGSGFKAPESISTKYLLVLAYNGVRGDYFKNKNLPVGQQLDLEMAGRKAARGGIHMYLQKDEWIWVAKDQHSDEVKNLGEAIVRDLMLKWPNVEGVGPSAPPTKERGSGSHQEEGPTLDLSKTSSLRDLYLFVAATGQPTRGQVLWMSPVGSTFGNMAAENSGSPFGERETSESPSNSLSPEDRLDPNKSYVVWVERSSSRFQIIHEFYLLPANQIPLETRTGGAAPDGISINNLVAFGFNGARYIFAQKNQPETAKAFESELMDRKLLRPEIFYLPGANDFAVKSAIEYALKSEILKGTEGKRATNWSEKLGLDFDDLERITSEYVASADIEVPTSDGGADRLYFHYSGLPMGRAYEVYSAVRPEGFDAKAWGKKANHLWVGFEISEEEQRELKNGDCFVMSPNKGFSICIRDVLGLSFHDPLASEFPGSKLAIVQGPACGLTAPATVVVQAPDFSKVILVNGIRKTDLGPRRSLKRSLDTSEVDATPDLLECLLPKATLDLAAGMGRTAARPRMSIDDMVKKR